MMPPHMTAEVSRSGGLSRLMGVLDGICACGRSITEGDLRRAFDVAGVTAADVEPFVSVSEGTYTRRRIVRREGYELLVLTWAPGQSSGPHDHAGSLCGLQVVRGTLREQFFADGPDGRCVRTSEHTESGGAMTIDPGVAIHSLSNPAQEGGELLVTVHVYAPPLAELRRHVPRPAGVEVPAAFVRTAPVDADRVVIVGGGFSGTLAAVHLLRAHPSRPLEVVLIDRQSAVGEGVAYRTTDRRHLLNVPAGRMSALPDDPEHFLRFARSLDASVTAGTFVSRRTYGEYLRHTLTEAAEHAPSGTSLRLVRHTAETVRPGTQRRWAVRLGTGERLDADAVILAVGHRPPADPFQRKWHGPRNRWIDDPWASFTLSAIRPDEPVLLLGSGLTAVDTLLSLSPDVRTAPIHLLSPRGLLPQPHATGPVSPAEVGDVLAAFEADPRPVRLMRGLRRKVSQVPDWRGVVDALRPHTSRLWQLMDGEGQAQFLRHGRRYWEVHRHRMPPEVAGRIGSWRKSGRIVVHAGRVRTFTTTPSRVHLVYSPADRPEELTPLDVNWVINCTGPGIDVRAKPHPVLRELLTGGHLSASELGLGLMTTDSGQAVTVDGLTDPSLLIIGTLRKAQLWESTAVPELRGQAAHAASAALAHLASLEPAAFI